MSLKDITLQFPSEPVTFKGGSFQVGGLSLSDITVLVASHKEDLNRLFNQYAAGGDGAGINPDASLPFIVDLVQMAPIVVAHAIALAEIRDAGAEPQIATALRLPVDVQVDAVEKILRLTFQTEGGLGKVMETVIRAFAGVVKAVPGLRT